MSGGNVSGRNITGRNTPGRNTSGGNASPLLLLLKCLLCSYIITALLLLVLALLLYGLNLGEGVVSAAIVLIYVAANFVGGFIAGKKLQNRKFMWGMMLGAAYFVVLAIVSLLVNQSVSSLGESFLTTLVLCAGGGMMGGMVS